MLPILSPYWAIAGGLLIGFAAALLLILSGRIAGVSGMVAAAVRVADRGPPWLQAAAFTIGLPVGAGLATFFVRRPDIAVTPSPAILIAGGVLVGIGTRLGNGCTSGHGVCGLARLSRRSAAATVTFLAFGIFTVFITRHVVGG